MPGKEAARHTCPMHPEAKNLKRRYAKGKIPKEEFDRMKEDIE
jgi:uncharacterized membrane protein